LWISDFSNIHMPVTNAQSPDRFRLARSVPRGKVLFPVMRNTIATIALAVLVAAPARAEGAMPAAFVDAAEVVEGLVVDMRYFGADNFVGARIEGYERPRCLLTRQAAEALALVQKDFGTRGLGVKVFDCYRPVRAVAHFIRWARDPSDQKRKAEFYPDVDKRDLFRLGYIATRSGHSRGSTVDLTLVRLGGEKPLPLDMGTRFDFFGRQSWPSAKSVGEEAQANRALLAAAMRRGGFAPYDREWWHFTLANEPFPHTYFDFPVR
jgi:D-alanyl-D-alanine dipeptidase